MGNKVCIVSFSDQKFAHLLKEMVLSVRRFPQSRAVDIAIFNNGMSEDDLHFFRSQVTHIADAQWNFPHAFLRLRSRWRMARTNAPFMREYFPGYDTYVWIDADAWVADWGAIDMAVEWASDGSLAIAPEADRCYDDYLYGLKVRWLLDRPLYATSFLYRNAVASVGRRKAREVFRRTTLNAGFMALRADAPHWQAWQKYMRMALDRGHLKGDQIPLNLSVYLDGLPVNRLPARCNWLVNCALPAWDAVAGRYVEPCRPHEPIGIIHLCGNPRLRAPAPVAIDIATVNGGVTRKTLRFEADTAELPLAAE